MAILAGDRQRPRYRLNDRVRCVLIGLCLAHLILPPSLISAPPATTTPARPKTAAPEWPSSEETVPLRSDWTRQAAAKRSASAPPAASRPARTVTPVRREPAAVSTERQTKPATAPQTANEPATEPQPFPIRASAPVALSKRTAPPSPIRVNRVRQANAEQADSQSSTPPDPGLIAPPAPGLNRIIVPDEEPQALPPQPDVVDLSLPVDKPAGKGKIDVTVTDDLISLVARDAPLNTVLGILAQQHGLNLVTAESTNSTISVTLNKVSLESALNAILRSNGYVWTRQDDIIIVTRAAQDSMAPPQSQGREMRVYTLKFISATDADTVVKTLLSPVGKSIVTLSDPLDKRKTREQLVVEDLPESLARIENYLLQADRAPRQVLVEAHILQVMLKDETRHGVDIQNMLARIDNADVTIKSTGMASPLASPAYFFGIDGTDLDVLVELIKQTTDSKTLAAPKVMVVDGQEAHIQTGSRIGYNTTTTTQTSTMQQVQFLDVGVILRVTPVITDDNQILLKVRPEVSDGAINATTNLPEAKTTEVDTTVLLNDGRGMVIGGLIQEEDTEAQAKLPIMGDLWMVGRLFQRRTFTRSRNEIIVVLVPRLVPLTGNAVCKEDVEIMRATSPVVGPHLERVDRRPVEPELPDAIRNPRIPAPGRFPDFFRSFKRPYPNPKTYYYPSADGDVQMRGLHPRDPDITDGPQPGDQVLMPEDLPTAQPVEPQRTGTLPRP